MLYGINSSSYVDSMPYHVTALPSVSVDPMVVSVFRGETVTVICRLRVGLNDSSRIYWFKDGRNLTTNNTGLLTLSSLVVLILLLLR